ncbi:STAS domain-containing protein [Kineococcus rhizosphaerae]|uniref:Anti-anti-sigma factor n=1 Tax=Kineococcus rhizosphaerae TaxID=559628 RepID=A0A2T0R383_9ACTN|nr:STAS domain-containing protein [Kineococcus rhizosphaerae]PRY14528.1 anti-anti-sigma factor [Kineococcus rhizosphaerae]
MRRPVLDTTGPRALSPTWPTLQEPPLRLREAPETDDDGRRHLELTGEFDAASVELVCAAVEHLLRPGQDVVVDVGAVTYCDTAAARALLACAHQATAARRRVFVVNARPFLRRLLASVGAEDLLGLDAP